MNKIIKFTTSILSSFIILTSCNKNSPQTDNKYHCKDGVTAYEIMKLDEDEKTYLLELKRLYYQQRFTDLNNTVYNPEIVANSGWEENYSLPGGVYGDIYGMPDHFYKDPVYDVNSIDDIQVFLVHPFENDEGIRILSFAHCGVEYVPGAWLSMGMYAVSCPEQGKRLGLYFKVMAYPEVFYNGKFYYIHEAFKNGIIDFNNPSLSLLLEQEYNTDNPDELLVQATIYSLDSLYVGL